MIRTLLKEVKEYKAASIATPIFMILEVLFETLIPFLMASIIDKGVNTGDIHHIYKVGGIMIVAAFLGLLAGMAGGRYGAKASTGFAKNLRNAMFDRIQTYSFANIDHFSTAGLVTRLTTDVTNVQNAYQMMLRMMMRAPASMVCAMVMAFAINARMASIYLVAVLILGIILFFIIRHATAYFQQAFPKYDALNESVQENVSAIRVVKAYVREEEETSKFKRASKNIYDIFVKAEKNVILECADHDVYSLYLYHFNQLVWCEDDCCGFSYNRRTDESSCLLYEYSYESYDAFDGFRHDFHEYGKYAPYCGSAE